MTTVSRRLRVLVAGTFDPSFARNRVVVSLLERNGFDVDIVQRELWGHERHTLVDASKLQLVVRALKVYPSLLWRVARAPRPDVIVVLYPGYLDMPFVAAVARARRIPILFDTFISLHDTVVGDRRLRSPSSVIGRVTRFADALACRLATLVLVDTPEHGRYFSDATRESLDHFRVLWLGAQEDVFHPPPTPIPPSPRLIVFHGTFIRLQGLDTIVRAAKLLEPEGVTVRIVGDGQLRPDVEQLVAELGVGNVELPGRVTREAVVDEIARATLCLGIFGTSDKALRVVPNKVFECLAVGRPVLTADTPAIRSAFAVNEEVAVVPPGDPGALASAALELLANPGRLAELGERGHERYLSDYSETALAARLGAYVSELTPR